MDTAIAPTITAEDAAAARSLAANIASCNLPLLLERAVSRAFDPTATAKVVLDTAEFSYKVSGMAAKQAERAVGPRFSIKIMLPGTDTADAKEIIIGHSSTVDEDDDDLPVPPEWLTQLDSVEEL